MERADTKYSLTWVGLLVVKDRKILMTREKGKTLFQMPGGGQEEGETNLETLNREVLEELGVTLKNTSLFDDFILPGRHEDTLIRFLIYTGDLCGEVIPGEDIDEIKWINSNYKMDNIDIGNPSKVKLIPRLLKEGIID